jgi:hypothetical protein
MVFSEGGVKSECRMSDAERNPKLEIRKSEAHAGDLRTARSVMECASPSAFAARRRWQTDLTQRRQGAKSQRENLTALRPGVFATLP